MKSKKALITGATGFIGSHLAYRLFSAGWDLHIIVRPESQTSLINKIINNVTLHHHDGSTAGMIHIFKNAKPDIVFHLASLFIDKHTPEDIEPMIRSNIFFGTQLLEAIKVCSINMLINAGTSWQHFDNEDYNPVCLYAATKQAYADILRYYIETTPLRAITLKLFDTYGPGDPRIKLFSLLQSASKSDMTLSFSPGDQLIDIVYIDDVIDAFIQAAFLLSNNTFKYDEFALSSGCTVSLKDLVNLYCIISGKNLSYQWGKKPYRPREVMIPWNKGKSLPGWQPKYSLEKGIRQILNA
jgi:nucleoside-diphosphate-sugar epimerase